MGITALRAISSLLAPIMLTMLVGAALGQVCPLQIGSPNVFRVARLQGVFQQDALRELITANFRRDHHAFREAVFYYEARLRPALGSLLQDPKVNDEAVDLLALIGVPEDLRLIIELPSVPKKRKPLPNRWAYSVACSLLDPSSEEEWSFPRKCALYEYDDRWVDAGAIQTLRLIASWRSREILEEAQRQNQFRGYSLARALEYIQSEPSPLTASNLEELADRIAQTIKIGKWGGNGKPRCNEGGDKALLDFQFQSGPDRLTYTATFHKIDGRWRLRGVQETLQALTLTPVLIPAPHR
jgi:hypothetical protein